MYSSQTTSLKGPGEPHQLRPVNQTEPTVTYLLQFIPTFSQLMQPFSQLTRFWPSFWSPGTYFWGFVNMLLLRSNWSKQYAFVAYHPRFFSRAEWWYHLLIMPVLFPLGNYYFIGPRYFRDPVVFGIGTAVVFVLYWLSIVILTLAVRWVLRRFPGRQQAILRPFVLLLVVGGLTTGLAIFDVWAYSLSPKIGVWFSWGAVWPIAILGYVFDVFLCVALILFGPDPAWRPGAGEPANPARLTNPALIRLGISPLEWGFHGLVVLVFIPVANHLLIGPRYWTDELLLTVGSAVVTLLYIPIAVLLTVVMRLAIRLYPSLRHTVLRVGLMLLLTGVVSSASAAGAVWVLSQVAVLGVSFSGENLYTLILLGLLFDLLFCMAHGYFYALSMWQRQQVENEQLKKETLQHQFDVLKGQLNPHFLFNSLNSLSSLIGEDTRQAERFVDDLAKVYRYLLQAGRTPVGNRATGNDELVSLQAELDFVTCYARLLQTRYGSSLRIEQRVADPCQTGSLPPLTLQTLIDNAMKHNTMLPGRPLIISIKATRDGQLRVRNNVQRKTLRIESGRAGLSNLITKYQLLGEAEPFVYQDEAYFDVTVPLIDVDCS